MSGIWHGRGHKIGWVLHHSWVEKGLRRVIGMAEKQRLGYTERGLVWMRMGRVRQKGMRSWGQGPRAIARDAVVAAAVVTTTPVEMTLLQRLRSCAKGCCRRITVADAAIGVTLDRVRGRRRVVAKRRLVKTLAHALAHALARQRSRVEARGRHASARGRRTGHWRRAHVRPTGAWATRESLLLLLLRVIRTDSTQAGRMLLKRGNQGGE